MPEDRAFLSCDSRQSPGSANRSLAPSRTPRQNHRPAPGRQGQAEVRCGREPVGIARILRTPLVPGDRRRGPKTLPPGIARRPHIGAHPRPGGAVASSGIPAVSCPAPGAGRPPPQRGIATGFYRAAPGYSKNSPWAAGMVPRPRVRTPARQDVAPRPPRPGLPFGLGPVDATTTSWGIERAAPNDGETKPPPGASSLGATPSRDRA